MNQDTPGSVFERVRGLIACAMDPDRVAAARDRACRELARMDPEDLRRLAMDADWQFVADALAGADVGQSYDQETDLWPDEEGKDGSPPSSAAHSCSAPGLRLEVYAHDIRRLVNEDFADKPECARRSLDDSMPASEIVRHCALAVPVEAWSADVARQLPCSRLGAGVALLDERPWAQSPGVNLMSFWSSALAPVTGRGVPRSLARAMLMAVAEQPRSENAFWDCVEHIDRKIGGIVMAMADAQTFVQLNLSLRTLVARWARRSEMMCAAQIAALELYASSRLIKAAGIGDLDEAWREGRGRAVAAMNAFRERNQSGGLRYEMAVRAVLTQPTGRMLESLSAADREALRFASGVRGTNPRVEMEGMLAMASGD